MVSAPALPAGSGGLRAVVERLGVAIQHDAGAVLGLVVATEGSTYAKAGAALLLGGPQARHGWISGGCLEPALDADAIDAAQRGVARLVALDTRADADLFFGSRLGCRGLLHVALLPVAQLQPLMPLLQAWSAGQGPLVLRLSHAGLHVGIDDEARHNGIVEQHRVGSSPTSGAVIGIADEMFIPLHWDASTLPDAAQADTIATVRWPAPPRLLLFGAGPETPVLLPWLRQLGWMVDLVERRARWRDALALADGAIETTPAQAPLRNDYAAALVMNHDFELDRDALEAIAATPTPFVGLLGPPARRDDLLALLPADARAALAGRLHAPVGLELGGRGAEAIALSIVAQLQSHVIAPQA